MFDFQSVLSVRPHDLVSLASWLSSLVGVLQAGIVAQAQHQANARIKAGPTTIVLFACTYAHSFRVIMEMADTYARAFLPPALVADIPGELLEEVRDMLVPDDLLVLQFCRSLLELCERAIPAAGREFGSALAVEPSADRQQADEPTGEADAGKPTRRSTERGEGRIKLIAALTKHHHYANGSCLNLEPIGNNELARLAGVAKRTASAFFDKEFQGHARYKALCGDAGRLAAALRLLNSEYAPHLLYGHNPPEKPERDDEADYE